jgi:hypothetical protein
VPSASALHSMAAISGTSRHSHFVPGPDIPDEIRLPPAWQDMRGWPHEQEAATEFLPLWPLRRPSPGNRRECEAVHIQGSRFVLCCPKGAPMAASKLRRLRTAPRYISSRGSVSVPPGEILVHNHVAHTSRAPSGTRGFRAWTQAPLTHHVECDCGWRPDLGSHYRVRLGDDD